MPKKKSQYRNDLKDLVKASYQSQRDAKILLGDRYSPDTALSYMNTKLFVDNKKKALFGVLFFIYIADIMCFIKIILKSVNNFSYY